MNIPIHSLCEEADFDHILALPRQILNHDWYGRPVDPRMEFCFGIDEESLWFLAAREKKAITHPEAKPGKFQSELWKYDVAEWFLHNPATGQYWEFNLSPDGAWWSCGFSSPRVQDETMDTPGGIITKAFSGPASWIAMARIPLDSLIPVVGGQPGIKSLQKLTLAATFILDTPEQIFLTTAEPKNGEPDFHQPHCFGVIEAE